MKSKLLSSFVIFLVVLIPFRLISQTTCPAPSNLINNNISTTGATLSWTAPTGAIAYIVQYRPAAVAASAWISVTTQSTSVSITNLTCNTAYLWHVAALCANGTTVPGPYSTTVDFTTAACTSTCVAPTVLTTTNIGANSATLSWIAPAGSVAYIVQYRSTTLSGGVWISVTAQTNTITLTNLACGTAYEWHVATICGSSPGNASPYSATLGFTTSACTTPCIAPSGLTTTNISSTSAVLSWVTPGNAYAYIIQYRRITSPVSAWINVTTQNPATSFTLTNLACGAAYEWHIAAYCGNNTTAISPYSATISFTTLPCTTTCVAPTNLHATNISTNAATLSWTGSPGAFGYIVQYHAITTPASAWITVTTQSASLTLTNLACGTAYAWHVATLCANGTTVPGPYSVLSDFITLPCTTTCVAPTNLQTTNISATGATLSWTGPTGAVGYIVQYRLAISAGAAWINLTTQTNSATLTNLICNAVYEWRVATVCGTAVANISPYSATTDFLTLACTTTCAAPTNPHATNISTAGATLSWTATTGALGYIIQYRPITTPAAAWINITTQNPATTFTLANLACGKAYEWHVAAICVNAPGTTGISPYSATADFITAPCTTTCVAPSGLITTNISTTGATLSWVATGAAFGYIVQYRRVTSPVSAWTTVNTQSASITLTNLVCGTLYEWHVAKICGTNTTAISPYSTTIQFTTAPCTNTCVAPSGLTTTNISTTGATLSWVSPGAGGAYLLQYRPVTPAISAWINITTQSTSVTLTNLVCGTHYQWHVARYCGSAATNISPYSPTIDFTTLPCTNNVCPVPGGLTSAALNTTGGSRMLTWSSTGALIYNIRYRITGTATWISTTSTTNSKLITGLQPSSHYEWQVQSVCSTASGAVFASAWSPSAFFDTPLFRAIFPNPASGSTIQLPVIIENESRVTVIISDHLGKAIRSIQKNIASGGGVIDIDIANLVAGIYFVQIKDGSKNEVQKLVIIR